MTLLERCTNRVACQEVTARLVAADRAGQLDVAADSVRRLREQAEVIARIHLEGTGGEPVSDGRQLRRAVAQPRVLLDELLAGLPDDLATAVLDDSFLLAFLDVEELPS